MENDDQYIKQLEEIFNEFCHPDNSGLNKEQLLALCNRLSLDGIFINRIFTLAFSKDVYTDNLISSSSEVIQFDEFCRCFVSVLSEVTEPVQVETFSTDELDVEDKISPRLVRGGRRYGRKSLPHSSTSENREKDAECNNGAHAVESEHWSPEILTPSDENEEVFNVAGRLYYEPGFGIEVPDKEKIFESNHPPSSFGSTKQVQQPETADKLLLATSDNVSSVANATSINTVFQESAGLNLFSKFTVDGCSAAAVKPVLELWEQAGISEPAELFQALELSPSEERLIDGFELTIALEKAALATTSQPASDNSHLRALLVCALVTSYKTHILHVNSEADQHKLLSEKMREDLERSELRTSKLIDEADDHYLSMDQQSERRMSVVEHKWMKKINSVQQSHERERDAMLTQHNQDKDAMRKEIDALRTSDQSLRRKLQQIRTENDSLSRESAQLIEKLSEAEKDAERLRKDLECLIASKTNDLSDPVNTSQEEKFAMIIKDYEAKCRLLADKNDELLVEIEELHSRIGQLESHDARNYSASSFLDEKLKESMSPKRKKPLRRNSSLSDSCSDRESDVFFGHVEKPKHENKDKYQSADFANMRMIELERLVEDLRDDKRKSADKFAREKVKVRAEMEKDFQLRLANEKAKWHNVDDNRAVEEQHNMTMRLLKEITDEKDDITAKYTKLKEAVEHRSSSNQQEMADLCREFANEKAELVSQHDEKIGQLSSKIEDVNRQLTEERKAAERSSEQLKNERSQHKEALAAHQEVICKFERAAANSDADVESVSATKYSELAEKYESEMIRVKQDHATELLAVKKEMEEKLNQLLSEKQKSLDSASVCSELEKLQENLAVEREAMHEKMHEMREAFRQEAHELKRLLDCDKAKLRKQLNDEVDSLRQRFAEEIEKEMKRKKQGMEEKERIDKLNATKQEREDLDFRSLQEEVEDLKSRNMDLEKLLSKTSSNLKELEMQRMQDKRFQDSCDVSQLEGKLMEMSNKLINKEEGNISLRKQVDNLLDDSKENIRAISFLKSNTDLLETEKIQLKLENDQLQERLRSLEREKLACRIENAGLNVRCEEMEKNGVNSPKSTPKSKSRRKFKADEEHLKARKEAEEKVSLLEKEIARLRTPLTRSESNKRTSPRSTNDSRSQSGSSVERQPIEPSISLLQSRLNSTRTQLHDQMKRSKDLYSKLGKSETTVKELYCENTQLMRALQLTEARQKEAERRYQDEKDRSQSLGRLLKQVCPDVV